MWSNRFIVTRFTDAQTIPRTPLEPCISTLELSVVIPAFNEEHRLISTLDSVYSYLKFRNRSFEIIVVDDGSTDNTAEVVSVYSRAYPEVRLMSIAKNRGKGYALKTGIMSAMGKLILINDADGSTPIEEFEDLEQQLSPEVDIAIGSRAKPSRTTRVQTSADRVLLGRVFNSIVQALLLPGIYDTQCGFKLFRADVARDVFAACTIDGFGYDVQVLYIARLRGYRTEEVAVNWRNVEGSKVKLCSDSPQMLLDVLSVAHDGMTGKYTGQEKQPDESQPTAERPEWMTLAHWIPPVILASFSVFLLYWFKLYAGAAFIPSNDLPGHIALVERLMPQLLHGRLTFYDPAWFSGWPACQFYAPLAEALTAGLAMVLAKWSHEPAQWACHIGLWLGCAVLPWTMWWFVAPMAKKITGTSRWSVADATVMACSVCFTSFWWLNHDYQWHGLGAAGVMNIGLYSQLLGWQFLLLHAGALARWLDSRKPSDERLVMVFFGLLCLTHTLSSMFALGFALLLSVWYSQCRLSIWRMHLIGIGLSCFWFFPALILSKTYAVPDIIRPQGDFFEILLRYPLVTLIKHVQDCFAWHCVPIDLGMLVIDAMFFLFLCMVRLRKSSVAIAFFLCTLITSFIASSTFIASSLPITIHYYRLYGYTVLYIASLLALVPIACVCAAGEGKWPRATKALAVLCALGLLGAAVYSTTTFPHYERQEIASIAEAGPSTYETQVLNFFRKQPEKGRVFIEAFDDYRKYPFLQARYLESRLFKDTGFESANGLFIQSSQACRIADTAAYMAGGSTWNCPYIYTKHADMGNAVAIEQLRDFGITHLLCGARSGLVHSAQEHGASETRTFGPYAVVTLAAKPPSKISVPQKTLVGYMDTAGNLPFGFVEDYAIAHKRLYSEIELVDLTGKSLQSCPPQITTVIVNEKASHGTYAAVAAPRPDLEIVHFQYRQYHLIDHYHVWYQQNFEMDAYEDVERCLDQANFTDRLLQLLANRGKQAHEQFASFDLTTTAFSLQFADDNQSLLLSNLTPGQLVKVNYSYFPFWHSPDAEIFRGSCERIYVLPQKSTVTLRYDPWSSVYSWLGALISLASLLAMAGVWRRLWRPVPSSIHSYLKNL